MPVSSAKIEGAKSAKVSSGSLRRGAMTRSIRRKAMVRIKRQTSFDQRQRHSPNADTASVFKRSQRTDNASDRILNTSGHGGCSLQAAICCMACLLNDWRACKLRLATRCAQDLGRRMMQTPCKTGPREETSSDLTAETNSATPSALTPGAPETYAGLSAPHGDRAQIWPESGSNQTPATKVDRTRLSDQCRSTSRRIVDLGPFVAPSQRKMVQVGPMLAGQIWLTSSTCCWVWSTCVKVGPNSAEISGWVLGPPSW